MQPKAPRVRAVISRPNPDGSEWCDDALLVHTYCGLRVGFEGQGGYDRGELNMWLRDLLRGKSRDLSERTCQKCDRYGAGHIDRRANWVQCGKGHRLIAEEEFVHEYRPHDNPDGPVVRVTEYGWSGGTGFGEPMLGRTDCPDWKKRRFRFDLGNPEYD
jgi:hypothetical protein